MRLIKGRAQMSVATRYVTHKRSSTNFIKELNNVLFSCERPLCSWLFCVKNDSRKASSRAKKGIELSGWL